MQFPHEIQAALLFDGRVAVLDDIAKSFMRVEEARTGARFNVPEAKPGAFWRLYGGDQLMITLEYVDGPADVDVLQQPLGSAITGILCPAIRERLMRNRTHVLVNVSHGALGNSPEIMRMLQQVDYPIEGQSLAQFQRRLEVCALIGRIASDHAPAQIVHWCQSNQLFAGEAFEALAAMPPPGPLHVHPFLFGGSKAPCGETELGIRTFGARHFVGREIVIQPSVLPWTVNYETILAFLRIATTKDGYIIPDGDTFGPEDRSQSYRVLHREAEADDVPTFELVPLMVRDFDFRAAEFVPHERAIEDRSPPPALMPADDEAKMELANQWREKRKLAERLGGRFEVRHRDAGTEPGSPPPAGPGGPPSPPGLGSRPVFGRKRA